MTLTKKGFDQKKITGCILALLRDEGNDETALRSALGGKPGTEGM
jgi:hypothetical protein